MTQKELKPEDLINQAVTLTEEGVSGALKIVNDYLQEERLEVPELVRKPSPTTLVPEPDKSV